MFYTLNMCNFICQLYLNISGGNFLNKIKGVPGGKNGRMKEKHIRARNVSESMSVSSYLRVSRGGGQWSHLKAQGDLLFFGMNLSTHEGGKQELTNTQVSSSNGSFHPELAHVARWAHLPGRQLCLFVACCEALAFIQTLHLLPILRYLTSPFPQPRQ